LISAAEKLRVSKPVHAAKGYYDDLDAAVSFHPHWSMPVCNTTVWDTHCGVGYNYVYTFACSAPENWLATDRTGKSRPNVHYAARAPGATDSLLFFYQLNESTRRSMLPASGLWSFNEAILTAGQATADNLVPQLAEIDYMVRADSIAQADVISAVMDNNAEAAAKAGFCRWRKTWVSKSRAGLANHVLARAGYRNLELAGPPSWGSEAIRIAQEIQRHLGVEPPEQPFLAATIDPTIQTAAKVIGATLIDLLTDTNLLARARTEFVERTGGGVGGERWQAPLLPHDFQVPHRLRWPEYVTTARGNEWCIPWREDE
jgi:aminobenzoyl-glutamate utilization protein B